MSDVRVLMVPVQRGECLASGGEALLPVEASEVPRWLAEAAYAEYTRVHGTEQSFERFHERGGFGPIELLDLLAGGSGNGKQALLLASTRDRNASTSRQMALNIAAAVASEITGDQEWREKLTIAILRAAQEIATTGIRPAELATVMRALGPT